MHDMAESVDLVVNVFERTYRTVLTPGWFPGLTASMPYPFAKRVALINNTVDPNHAHDMAQHLISINEIDEMHFVADHLEAALNKTGLSRSDLEPLQHFSDCALVALNLPHGSPYLLYWDADVTLATACDWVTPSLQMLTRADVVVANPAWDVEEALAEAAYTQGDYAIGYGFSDTVFLCKREKVATLRLGAPMVPASYRYPLAHIKPIFEQRVDSAMRRARLHRATYLLARTTHHGDVGTQYPYAGRLSEVRRRIQSIGLRASRLLYPGSPLTNPYPKASARTASLRALRETPIHAMDRDRPLSPEEDL